MATLDEKIYIPAHDRDTSVRKIEAEFLRAFVRNHRITRTLEIGFAYGYSAAYIMDATGSDHVVIDPNQSRYEDQGLKNIAALGFAERCHLMRMPSHSALPILLSEGKKVQFIFVDGGHRYDQIFIDWYYCDLLLEVGGFIVFHDRWMRSTQMVTNFIRTNRDNYKEVRVPLGNLVVFEKISEKDTRTWDHFREFASPVVPTLYWSTRNTIKHVIGRIKKRFTNTK